MTQTSGELWTWRQDGTAHAGRLYFNIAGDAAAFVRETRRRGVPMRIGPIPIGAAIGESSWDTSVADASSFNGYLLEVPKSVAARERLSAGDKVTVRLSVRPDAE